MKNKIKQKKIIPDDVFECGVLRVARYGKNILFSSNRSESDSSELLKHNAAMYPEVVLEIDRLVTKIKDFVSELPPDLLMYNAWWEMAQPHINIETEADVDPKDRISVRMVGYIQSMIASVTPSKNQRTSVTQEEWGSLREKIGGLFNAINHYQICRTAKAKIEDIDYNDEIEKFRYKAQMYWCNVRGNRYQVHEPDYIRDIFLPHSSVLEEIFGITGECFVQEIIKICHSLSFGLQDAYSEIGQVLSALGIKSLKDIPTSEAKISELIIGSGYEKSMDNIIVGKLFGMDMFDLQKITSLPTKLLDELSWVPGEDAEFLAEGEFCGWPLRVWSNFKRPFLKLNEHYYCFDLHNLCDHIYRIMQRIILRHKPEYKENWKKSQQKLTEELPIKYIQKILPGAKIFSSVFYPNLSTTKKDRCETDSLVLYDDHLFVVECRGGAFTHTSPATDFNGLIESLKNLALKPATQGRRFFDYLNSSDVVSIYNEKHQEIYTLRAKDFRNVTICSITLDQFTEIAAQVQHLKKIGIDIGCNPVWVMSLDDLRVYADIFDNPLIFLHFVEQRMRAFHSDAIQDINELEHLGSYIKHNNYSRYAEKMRGEYNLSNLNIILGGYQSDIDKYFYRKAFEPTKSYPLRQYIPHRILEIIELLSNCNKPARSKISSYLLDLNDSWREKLSNSINEELKKCTNVEQSRSISLYLPDGVYLTVHCYINSLTLYQTERALQQTYSIMLLNNEERRVLLELSYTDNGMLQDINWQWLDYFDIPSHKLFELEQNAEKIRQKRISSAKIEKNKIGRNEFCPCASGKKYKKCCLNRSSS